ncbi:MAG TPA: PadR family transcriptional regulator, partial [Acidimicrobiia bacterium]|nr:PadR family transcriptional regulator [Acidimicrobiia bacterium]
MTSGDGQNTSDQAEPRISVTEYTVLGVMAEEPTHGFALAKKLAADSSVGRVFTVRRPLVYRAIDRLVETGYAEGVTTEKGDGPKRVIYTITTTGRERLHRWLNEPVAHVRDLRIEFLLKLSLLQGSGHSPVALIRNQRTALASTFEALHGDDIAPEDHVELWRKHNAA